MLRSLKNGPKWPGRRTASRTSHPARLGTAFGAAFGAPFGATARGLGLEVGAGGAEMAELSGRELFVNKTDPFSIILH